MTLFGWALYGLAAAAALGVVVYLYRFREPAGRGRRVLGLLRWLTLAVLLLLVFDPEFPEPGLADDAPREWIALDASLSMALPAGADATRWEAARAEARRRGGPVLVFGDEVRVPEPDALDALEPDAPATRLAPAIAAAAEAGARRLVVLSDAGFEDALEAGRLAARAGVELEVERVGAGERTDLALAELEAPRWAEAGKPLELRVGVVVTGAAGVAADSVEVVASTGGEVVARTRVAPPAPGRVATGTLRFPARGPEEGGLVRYDVEIVGDDAVADDDARSAYVYVTETPAGVVLVSFAPDWELRFLQPVLEQALGLPVRGFLRAGPGRYARVAPGPEAARAASEAEVRRAVAQADLLVFQGLGAAAPEWAAEAAARAQRLLHFPAGGASRIPIALPAPVVGDWYVSEQVPASPVAAALTGLPLQELSPLPSLRPTQLPAGSWTPLVATQGRGGEGWPVVIAGQSGERRWAVATAEDYWQWAFRGGEPQAVYRRLWSALAGWMMREDRPVAAGAVYPVERVVARGVAPRWVAPGIEADSVALQVTGADGAVVLDTTVALAPGDTLVAPVLPPGHYAYRASAAGGGEAGAGASGPLTVEAYSPEFVRAPVEVPEVDRARSLAERIDDEQDGVPLHAMPWPYLLLVGLLCAEWILRRRWGLR